MTSLLYITYKELYKLQAVSVGIVAFVWLGGRSQIDEPAAEV